MRVLVVEDEQDIRHFLKKSLESECYVVDEAEDGEQALALVRGNKYDLIVSDNVMPRKSGLELCQETRKMGFNVPIIVVSVKSETTTKVDLLNAGADDYLTKPFSVDELLARSRALLRRPVNMDSEVFELDDLKVDARQHLVTRGGDPIKLTKKEFTLLKYLIRNKGAVLSRSMLMEHVWDTSTDKFTNTIESHINSLRKKIDLPGKKKLLRTVSGRGYKIDDK